MTLAPRPRRTALCAPLERIHRGWRFRILKDLAYEFGGAKCTYIGYGIGALALPRTVNILAGPSCGYSCKRNRCPVRQTLEE
jgi:hypothetical protein